MVPEKESSEDKSPQPSKPLKTSTRLTALQQELRQKREEISDLQKSLRELSETAIPVNDARALTYKVIA